MLESTTIDSARIHDGTQFELVRRSDEWMVRVDGRVLMSSRMHYSEEALAEHAIERVPRPDAVLVGGLGLGFTLRAVLDRVPSDAKVTVAEIVPSLVDWNREHVGGLADHPLADPRCQVVVADVFEIIKGSPSKFDVILLDVDNGPVALSQAKNQRLYADYGLRACASALRPNGVLGVWSAGPNARFERKLASVGFATEVLRVSARKGSRGSHVLFLAERRADVPAAGFGAPQRHASRR
jgi:spermidine synthase